MFIFIVFSHFLLTLVCSSNFFIYYFKHGSLCRSRANRAKRRNELGSPVQTQGNLSNLLRGIDNKTVRRQVHNFNLFTYSHLSNNCGGWNKRGGVQKLKNQLAFFRQFLSQNKVLQLKMRGCEKNVSSSGFVRISESFVMKSI